MGPQLFAGISTMKDLYEAIECQSALLSYRLERCAQNRGFSVHNSGYTISPKPGQFVRLYHTRVHLPQGIDANFSPRAEPQPDGQSWHFDIQRGDGIVRSSFAQGLSLVHSHSDDPDDDGWVIIYNGPTAEPLNADHIQSLFNELQLPGPSGLQLQITRFWTIRFGRPSLPLASAIERLSNVDHMALIYDALLDQRSRKQILGLIENEAPLSAGPQPLRYLPRD
jgi:hypothetical protein